jgi:signal transduction histidine kinase/DNA-binding NarL/FixJ family response regulator/HPt (histidine-containing phosphotransfer) domain-containing protein
MAAALDRSPVSPPASRRPAFSGLGLIGFGLLIALLAVALVQARQYSLVTQALKSGDDYAVLTIYQAEIEYLRLREAWQRATQAGGDRAAAEGLKLRYDVWVSRVSLLEADRPRRLIADVPEHVGALQSALQFIALADRALGAKPEIEATPAFLADRWPALEALGAPFHALSLGTAHRVAEQMQARNEAVRAQNRLGLSLTVFMSVLTLAFAFIALRQLRQLRQRRVVLEELAANLGQARREAESASQAKSAFLANISHEIRTPFHGLMGMLSLLRETGLTPKQIDYLRTATESADHLLAILNDILDMSQLESGRLTLNPAAVDLRSLLRDVEALMRPQASLKSLALHIDIDPGVPERVMADATRLKQILFNLLSNAIKFSDQGVVLLHLRQRPAAGSEPELEFAVVDTGIGMDEATMARLFTRFTQGDNSRSRRHAGTGLGLEISRNLARLMHGDITVSSKPGEGSRFVLRVPLQAVADALHGPAAAPHATPATARALRVLVAEDHPVNRQYLAALLDNLGHRAHFCANGQEAVQAARDGSFDLVLMDLHMPLLDGVDATRDIRALPDAARSTVPIVAMTADGFAETRERCLVAGMNDFLTKPVSPQKLATLLRQLFGSGAEPTASERDQPPRPGRPPPAAGQAPLLDEAAIESALGAMPRERFGAMVASFLDQGPQTVQHLRAAVRDAQPLELRVNAHAAKGAALNLGLAALAHTAQALQEGAAHLPAHEIARLVQTYEDLLVRTRRAAEQAGLLGPGGAATR